MCFLLLQYLILIGGQGLCPWIPLGALIAPQIPNWVDIPSPEIPGFATVCPPYLRLLATPLVRIIQGESCSEVIIVNCEYILPAGDFEITKKKGCRHSGQLWCQCQSHWDAYIPAMKVPFPICHIIERQEIFQQFVFIILRKEIIKRIENFAVWRRWIKCRNIGCVDLFGAASWERWRC